MVIIFLPTLLEKKKKKKKKKWFYCLCVPEASTLYQRNVKTNKMEPRHDKTNKMSVRPAKTQISLGICPVWSESSLSAWRKLGSLATHWAHREDSDQTQADLGVRWAHSHFVGFVMSRLTSYSSPVSARKVNVYLFAMPHPLLLPLVSS